MAEQKTNRSDTSKQGSATMARRDREQDLQRRQQGGSWLANPFELMDRMADDMDRAFGRIFREFGGPSRSWLSRAPFGFGGSEREAIWSPRVETFQQGDRFVVRAELPGLKKEDVQVDVTDDAITIHGERRNEHQEEREGYYHSEREYGQFERVIPIPEGTITESAQASFKNGVLEITIQAPPAETRRGRRLDIKESAETAEKK